MESRLDGFSDTVNITVYRVIQEGLTNIAKYAEAANVSIELICQEKEQEGPEKLILTIDDDGKGINLDQPFQGLGITGMRERVLAASGEFLFQSNPGEGVHIHVVLPQTG